MKSEIFSFAINNRKQIKFLYGLQEVVIEPYYYTRGKDGKKVIYGKMYSTNQIRKFEYEKIANIRVLKTGRFSPIIPILCA
jgi:hypothetical protein